jgi:dTDP-4-dehydrorhamnose 3,5-epimerase
MEGVLLADLDLHVDSRGSFSKLDFSAFPITPTNSFAVSRNALAGTVRGLHFQENPHGQSKIVSCLSGSFDDFFLDLRTNSDSFGKWARVRFDDDNLKALFLPQGIAHGFQTLKEKTTVIYFFDKPLVESSKASYSFFDSALGIELRLPVTEISDMDRVAPMFSNAFIG